MGKIHKKAPPEHSLFRRYTTDNDFWDRYATEATATPRQAAEIAVEFPYYWAQLLLYARHRLVAPFGLSTSGAESGVESFGIFPIVAETSDEIILGFDDKHLDFRISVFSNQGMVYFATWVKTHNLGGKLYLGAVLPFHKLIVRNSVARVAQTYPPLARA